MASVFNVKVADEEWDTKHKLALEREMLGLYVSGHPLDGAAMVARTARITTTNIASMRVKPCARGMASYQPRFGPLPT